MYHVQYKDQQLPIIIDFAVIKVVCKKLDLKITDFEQIINDPSKSEILFYEGLKRGHKLESKELLFKESDCEDLLSDCYADFLKIFNDCVIKMFTSKKN